MKADDLLAARVKALEARVKVLEDALAKLHQDADAAAERLRKHTDALTAELA